MSVRLVPRVGGRPDCISRAVMQFDPRTDGRYPLRGLPAPSCPVIAAGRQPRRARPSSSPARRTRSSGRSWP